MATLLYPGKEFRITHQEMIKGIRKGTSGTNYRYVIKQQGLVKSKEFPKRFQFSLKWTFGKSWSGEYLGTCSRDHSCKIAVLIGKYGRAKDCVRSTRAETVQSRQDAAQPNVCNGTV